MNEDDFEPEEIDVILCRLCGRRIGYWQDDDEIVASVGFRMCFNGFTCLDCLEVNDECEP